MQSRVVRVSEISSADEESWQRLASSAVEPNPSFEPDILVPVCRNIDTCSDVRLVIAEDRGTIRGAMPVRSVRGMRFEGTPELLTPKPAASFTDRIGRRIKGTEKVASTFDPRWPPPQFSCAPLLDGDCAERALGALLETFAKGSGHGLPSTVLFVQLPADGAAAEALRQVCSDRGYSLTFGERWERGLVTRGQWEAPLSPKHRRAFSRYRRQIAEACGGDVSVDDVAADPSAIDDFLRIELSGWKGRESGRAYGKDAGAVASFRDSHQRLLAQQRVHLLALRGGERTVAMQYYVRSGEGLFTWRIAYDEELAGFSPGSVLFAAAVEYLGENTDAAWLDSGTQPGNQFFLRLMPARRQLCEAVVRIPGPPRREGPPWRRGPSPRRSR